MRELFPAPPVLAGDRLCLPPLTGPDAENLDKLVREDAVYRYLPTFLFEKQYDPAEAIARLYEEGLRDSLILGASAPCNAAERTILEKLGVRFTDGDPERVAYAAVYPELFPIRKKDAAGQIEEGHEAAKSIHRALHPGHSQTLARDPRSFRSFRRDDVVLPPEKIKNHACLSCGVSYVDPNRCIGCGICTTRCFFDAIHLVRSHPEFVDYCSADDTVKKVVLGGVRRAGRIATKIITDQR